MKRSFIKSGAIILCTAVAITLFGNANNALAFEYDVPYEEFGFDRSDMPDYYVFCDYCEYGTIVVLTMEIGGYPTGEMCEIYDEAVAAVNNIYYDRSLTFDENVAILSETLDYYLDLLDQARLRDPYFTSYEQEREHLIFELNSWQWGFTPAAQYEFRKAARALEALEYDDSLSLDENRLIMYRTMRNLASFED